MKIVYFTKLAPQLGTTRVYEVCTRLAKAGHDVTVVSAATHRDQAYEETHGDFTVIALRTAPAALRTQGRLGFLATRLPYYHRCATWLRRTDQTPDVIVEDVAPLASPRLARQAAKRRIPHVYQIHSAYTTLNEWYTNYGPLGLFGYLWQKRIWNLRAPAAVYSDAKWSTDRVAEMGIPSHWIPNGVNQAATVATEKRPQVRRLLTVGRLVRLKNQELLIKILRHLTPDVELTIVGSGPLETRLRALTSSIGLDDRVHFQGHSSHDQLEDHYRAADLFLLPSLAEGQPLTVLEAMAIELPVLMSDIPAADGVVTASTGWLLPVDDPRAWADCISGAASDREERIEKGKAARARVEELFNWESTAEAELALLNSVAATERTLGTS